MNDYSKLIDSMKFYLEPEVSWSRWFLEACIQEGEITELGAYLQKKLQSGTFIDVPCGYEVAVEADDTSIVSIAALLGVQTYIEVDIDEATLGSRLQNNHRKKDGFVIKTQKADILEFLSAFERTSEQNTLAIYISGLQPDADFSANKSHQAEIIVPYLEALYSEIDRCTNVGDIVILNEVSTLVSGISEEDFPHIHPSLALGKYGFSLQRTCQYQKVSVFEKLA